MGEIVEDAAKREVFEETGLTVNSMQLFGVFSGPDLHHIYPDGNEVDDLQWFAMSELPEKLSPPIKRALLQFIERHLSNTADLPLNQP